MSQRDDAIRPILAATVLSLLVSACAGAGAHVDKQLERPAVIRFGASAAELERAVEGQCTQRQLRTDDPVFLPDVRKGRQWQIDCEGFQFFGQGRHVEFVLRDDRLVTPPCCRADARKRVDDRGIRTDIADWLVCLPNGRYRGATPNECTSIECGYFTAEVA